MSNVDLAKVLVNSSAYVDISGVAVTNSNNQYINKLIATVNNIEIFEDIDGVLPPGCRFHVEPLDPSLCNVTVNNPQSGLVVGQTYEISMNLIKLVSNGIAGSDYWVLHEGEVVSLKLYILDGSNNIQSEPLNIDVTVDYVQGGDYIEFGPQNEIFNVNSPYSTMENYLNNLITTKHASLFVKTVEIIPGGNKYPGILQGDNNPTLISPQTYNITQFKNAWSSLADNVAEFNIKISLVDALNKVRFIYEYNIKIEYSFSNLMLELTDTYETHANGDQILRTFQYNQYTQSISSSINDLTTLLNSTGELLLDIVENNGPTITIDFTDITANVTVYGGNEYTFSNLRPVPGSITENFLSYVSGVPGPSAELLTIPSISIIGSKSTINITNDNQQHNGVIKTNASVNNISDVMTWDITFADGRNFATTTPVSIQQAKYLNYKGDMINMIQNIDYTYVINNNNTLTVSALKVGERNISIVLTVKDDQGYSYSSVTIQGNSKNVTDSELLGPGNTLYQWTTDGGVNALGELQGNFIMPTVEQLFDLKNISFEDNGEMNRVLTLASTNTEFNNSVRVTEVIANDGTTDINLFTAPDITQGTGPSSVSYPSALYNDQTIIDLSKDGYITIKYFTINSDGKKSNTYTLTYGGINYPTPSDIYFVTAMRMPAYIINSSLIEVTSASGDVHINPLNVLDVSNGRYEYVSLSVNQIKEHMVLDLSNAGYKLKDGNGVFVNLTTDMFDLKQLDASALVTATPYAPTVDITEYNNNTDKSREYHLIAKPAILGATKTFDAVVVIDIIPVDILTIVSRFVTSTSNNRGYDEDNATYKANFSGTADISGGLNVTNADITGDVTVSENIGNGVSNDVSVTMNITDGVQIASDIISMNYTWDYYTPPTIDISGVSFWSGGNGGTYPFWKDSINTTIVSNNVTSSAISLIGGTNQNDYAVNVSYSGITNGGTGATSYSDSVDVTASYTGIATVINGNTIVSNVSNSINEVFTKDITGTNDITFNNIPTNPLVISYTDTPQYEADLSNYLTGVTVTYWDGSIDNNAPTVPQTTVTLSSIPVGDSVIISYNDSSTGTIKDGSYSAILSDVFTTVVDRESIKNSSNGGLTITYTASTPSVNGSNSASFLVTVLTDANAPKAYFKPVFATGSVDISGTSTAYYSFNDLFDISSNNAGPFDISFTLASGSYVYNSTPNATDYNASQTALSGDAANKIRKDIPGYYIINVVVVDTMGNINPVSNRSTILRVVDGLANEYILPSTDVVLEIDDLLTIANVGTIGSIANSNDVNVTVSGYRLPEYYTGANKVIRLSESPVTTLNELNTEVPADYEISYNIIVPNDEVNGLYTWTNPGQSIISTVNIKVVDTNLPSLRIEDQSGDITSNGGNGITQITSTQNVTFNAIVKNGVPLNSHVVVLQIQKIDNTSGSLSLSTLYTLSDELQSQDLIDSLNKDVITIDVSQYTSGHTVSDLNTVEVLVDGSKTGLALSFESRSLKLNNGYLPTNYIGDATTSYIITMQPMNIEGKYIAMGKIEVILVSNGGPTIGLNEQAAYNGSANKPAYSSNLNVADAPDYVIQGPTAPQRFSMLQFF